MAFPVAIGVMPGPRTPLLPRLAYLRIPSRGGADSSRAFAYISNRGPCAFFAWIPAAVRPRMSLRVRAARPIAIIDAGGRNQRAPISGGAGNDSWKLAEGKIQPQNFFENTLVPWSSRERPKTTGPNGVSRGAKTLGRSSKTKNLHLRRFL